MSRIYFHSEHGTAELRGSERHHMASVCAAMLPIALGPIAHAEEWLKPLLPPRHYLRTLSGPQFASSFQTWLRVGGITSHDNVFHIRGREVDPFTVGLNTALVVGNDVVKLMARLHGQCELHCYVEGPNRAWLAGIARQGRATGLLRADEGWEEVIAFLEERDDAPVVTSYSVCERFPNLNMLPDDHPLQLRGDDERWDAFHDLSAAECWRLCMSTLRAMGDGRELKPDNWSSFHFGAPINGFTLREAAAGTDKPALRAG